MLLLVLSQTNGHNVCEFSTLQYYTAHFKQKAYYIYLASIEVYYMYPDNILRTKKLRNKIFQQY